MKWRMKLPQKMRFKILILCLASTMAALILQTWLFNRRSSTLIYEQAKAENLSMLGNLQGDLFSTLKTVENNIIKVYNRQELMKDLKAGRSAEELRQLYYREAFNVATDYFDTADGVLALYIYNSDDEIISTYRRAVTPRHNYPVTIYDPAMENNAQTVRDYVHTDKTTMLISSYYNEHRDTDIIRFAMKLYNNSNTSQMIGYLVCDIDSKILRYRMEKFITDENMFIWLQPDGDRPAISLGRLGSDDNKTYQQLTDLIMSGADSFAVPAAGSRRVFFQVEQTKYNLSVYALMPQALLVANQQSLTNSLIIIAAVMFIITLGASYIFSKSLTRPLEELTETTERIKQGETELRVPVQKYDEIGELGNSFNEMLDRIEGLISREYETKLLLNRAEYNALQAQINPHFLYNTLDTMSSIAQIQKCDEVSRLSQSLSNIFRYALDMKNPFSTLSKELFHLKNYIYVMTVRMQDHVIYDFDIDDELLKDLVPRICIQPLVENALNHGLRNVKGEKRINIGAKQDGEYIIISVQDNGVGLACDSELNKKLAENKIELVEAGNSIGLININARVKMLYGDTCGLRIESQLGIGTRVILKIARMAGEDEAWKSKYTKF